MNARTTVVWLALLGAGGCKDKPSPPAAGTAAGSSTATGEGAAVVMDPAPPAAPAPPAVAAGSTRLDRLDLDLELPTGSQAEGADGDVDVSGAECSFQIQPDWPYPDLAAAVAAVTKPSAMTRNVVVVDQRTTADGWSLTYTGEYAAAAPPFRLTQIVRKVGGMRVACIGKDACMAAACASIRTVPGGTAERPFPDGVPAIAVSTRGGIDGGSRGGFRIWADGRVHYHAPGARCPKWRGRMGTLPPSRVKQLIAAAEQAGFFDLKPRYEGDDDDCIDRRLTIRAAGKEHTSSYEDCGRPASPELAALIDLISRAVANPDAC